MRLPKRSSLGPWRAGRLAWGIHAIGPGMAFRHK
jgi:hypothetical protein